MTTVNLAQESVDTSTATYTRLKGTWLRVARVVWIVLVTATTILYVAALPARWDQLHTYCTEAPCPPSAISPRGEEILTSAGWSLDNYALAWLILEAITLLFYLPVALLIFWRRSDDWMALFVSAALLLYGLSLPPVSALIEQNPKPVLILAANGLLVFGEIAVVILFFIFPNGRFAPRWTRWLAVAYVVADVINAFIRDQGFGLDAVIPIMLGFVVGAATQVYRYRRVSSPTERQQTKWAVLGLIVYAAALFISVFPIILFPSIDPAATVIDTAGQFIYLAIIVPVIYLATYALPIFFAISILRYRLWDVDPILNRSLVFGGLTLVLGAIFVGGFFGLRTLLESVLGSGQVLAAIAVPAVLVTALFNPARQRLQRFVDRRFYHIYVDYHRPGTPARLISSDFIPAELAAYGELTPIGKGGMAEVYRATHPTLQQPVAIKILPPARAQDPDYRQRFEREARLVAGLQHPNIVQLFDYGQAGETHFMVMEFIDGPTLSDTIRERAPMALPDALPIIEGIAAALDYAHENGLVHRDVKPSNVMLDQGSPPRVVLMDFGIAKVVGGRTRLTQTGNMVGTLDYIAPEQIQAAADVDGRADVYALGVIAFQMLTGQRPFHQQNPGALLIAHLQQPAPDPRILRPDLPDSAADAIRRAMKKAPGERFVTAGDFAATLTK